MIVQMNFFYVDDLCFFIFFSYLKLEQPVTIVRKHNGYNIAIVIVGFYWGGGSILHPL